MLPDPRTLTLRDYLVPVVKRRWMILALVIVITAIVSAYYATRPLTYAATTQVFIGPSSDPALGAGPSEPTLEAVANQATLLTSTEEAAIVAKKIGYTGSPAGLAASVTATPSQTTNVLSISAQASSSAQAARIANAFAQQFINQNTASQVTADNRQVATLTKQLQSLKGAQNASQRQSIQSQIQQLQLAASTTVGSAKQINVAQAGVASSHSVVEYGVLAALGALIGGVLLAFLLERLDPRLKGIQHTEQVYKHPVLATVWHDGAINHFVDDKPALSPRSREAFRDLRIVLDLAASDEQPLNTIVVASAVQSEGKSTVARNLALVLSEGGRRVCLVDADLRKPALARALGLKPRSGLTELLAGTRTLDDVLTEVSIDVPKATRKTLSKNGKPLADDASIGAATERIVYRPSGPSDRMLAEGGPRSPAPGYEAQPSLFFISSGAKTPNPQGVLESEGFRSLVDQLGQSFDVVVIDGTPLTMVSDTIPVVRCVDAVLLVSRSSTDARSALHAADILQRVPGANVIGLVVNDVPETEAAAYGKGYGYGYYGYGPSRRYGYGYGDEPEAEGDPAPGAPRPDPAS